MKKSSILTPKEKILLDVLQTTYNRHFDVFLDLTETLKELSADKIQETVDHLKSKKFVQQIPSVNPNHVLCRITPLGLDALRMSRLSGSIKTNKKHFIVAFLILAAGAATYTLIGIKDKEKSLADILSLDDKSRPVLENWMRNNEGEDPLLYTYSLLEKYEGRDTYLAECKIQYLDNCKYNIVFIDIDEKTNSVISAEAGRE